MDLSKTLEIILSEWSSTIHGEQARMEHVSSNFEDLFSRWKSIGATFEDVYEAFLPRAIKAHYPTSAVIKRTYKNLKHTEIGSMFSERELEEDWKKTISSKANEAFFYIYPPPKIEDEDDAPKVYGNMSEKEYRAQRTYANSIPTLKTDALVKAWKMQQTNKNPLSMEEILNIIDNNVLGDKNGSQDS